MLIGDDAPVDAYPTAGHVHVITMVDQQVCIDPHSVGPFRAERPPIIVRDEALTFGRPKSYMQHILLETRTTLRDSGELPGKDTLGPASERSSDDRDPRPDHTLAVMKPEKIRE